MIRGANERLSIVVSGMLAGDPFQGGATWAVLQYVLGLQALGHRVFVIEPVGRLTPTSTQYFDDVMRRFALDSTAAMVERGTQTTAGVAYERLAEFASSADLLLNISGMLREPELVQPIPRRVYLDLDPAFNQLWHAQGVDAGLDGHTDFVTIGMKLGDPTCPIPLCDRPWIKTWQPIVLSHWPWAPTDHRGALTAIGNWRGYGSIEWNGVQYGQKAHSFREFIDLPARTAESFHLALAIDAGEVNDLALLAKHGWSLVDPRLVTATPWDYQAFIQSSKGELGIAKSGYVKSRCGWFSDRSVAYLASGRPVIAQATGFEDLLPTGKGLFSFTGYDDLQAAIDSLDRDYDGNRRAARQIAEEYFEAAKVLPCLLDRLGNVR